MALAEGLMTSAVSSMVRLVLLMLVIMLTRSVGCEDKNQSNEAPEYFSYRS